MRLGTLTAIALLLAACPARAAEFYFYLNGDNDLITLDEQGNVVSQADRTLAVIERVAQDADVSAAFHIYVDPSTKFTGANAQTRIIRYVDGRKVDEEAFSETDSGDPKWLERLLSVSLQPGTPKALALWGHGDHWLPVENYDFSASGAPFQYLELADLIGRHQVDLLIFDACQMGAIEVLSAFASKVKTVIAAQFDLPVDGIYYGGLAAFLKTDAGQSPGPENREWAARLFDHLRGATRERMRLERKPYVPIVAYDLAEFPVFRDSFNRTLGSVMTALRAEPDARRLALWKELVSRAARGDYQVDVRAFAHHAKRLTGVDTHSLVSAFERLLYKNFGSAGFFMPQDFGLRQDPDVARDAAASAGAAWAAELENWNWIREWVRPKGEKS